MDGLAGDLYPKLRASRWLHVAQESDKSGNGGVVFISPVCVPQTNQGLPKRR
jgi:hypothetical protein